VSSDKSVESSESDEGKKLERRMSKKEIGDEMVKTKDEL